MLALASARPFCSHALTRIRFTPPLFYAAHVQQFQATHFISQCAILQSLLVLVSFCLPVDRRRLVWLVLQLVFGEHNFLRADWEESIRVGRRPLVDLVSDVYVVSLCGAIPLR